MARNTNIPSSKRQPNNSFNAHDNDFARVPSGNQQIEQKKDNALSGDLAEIVKAIQLSCDRTTAIFSAITGINVSKNKDYDSLKGEAKKQGNIIKNILDNINKEEFLVKGIKKLNSAKINIATKNPILEDFFYGENADDFETILARYLNKDNLGLNLPDANHLTGPIEDYLKAAFGSNGYFFENFFNKLAPQKSGVKDFGSLADYYVKEFSKANNINSQKTTKNDLDVVIKGIKEEIDLIQNFYQSIKDRLNAIQILIKNQRNLPKNTTQPGSTTVKPTQNNEQGLSKGTLDQIKLAVDIVQTLNTIKINRNVKKNIKSLEKLFDANYGSLAKLLNNIHTTNKEATKEKNASIQGIANYLQSIVQLGQLDEKGIKQLKRNIRELDWMFMDEDLLTKTRIWNKGLMTMLIHDIDKRCAEIQTSNDQSRKIKNFINDIISIGNSIDLSSIQSLFDSIKDIDIVFAPKGPVRQLIQDLGGTNGVANLKSFQNLTDKEKSPIKAIKILFEDIIDIVSSIKKNDINKFNIIMGLSGIAGKLTLWQAKVWNSINDDEIKNEKLKIESIKDVVTAYIELLPKGMTFEELNSTLGKLIDMSLLTSILGITVKAQTKTWNSIDDDKFLNTIIKIQGFKDIVDAFNNVYKDNNQKDVDKIVGDLISMELKSQVLAIVFGLTNKVWNEVNTEKQIDNIQKLIEITKKISSISSQINTNNLENTKKVLSTLNKVEIQIIIAGLIAKPAQLALNVLVDGKKSFLENLRDFVNKINTLDKINENAIKNVDKIKEGIKNIEDIAKASTLTLGFTVPGILGMIAMSKMLNTLQLVINTVNGLNINENAIDNIKSAQSIVEESAKILVIGAAVGMLAIISMPALLAFDFALSALIFSTVKAYAIAGKGIEKALPISDQFIDLVWKSAKALIIGGLVMMLPGMAANTFIFGAILAGFILTITAIYTVASKLIDKALEPADNFIALVGLSATALLVGGSLLAMFPTLVVTVPLFAGMLTLFVGGILAVYWLASKFIEDALEVSKEFVMLVGVSALALTLGALFITDGWRALGAIGFGIILSGFVIAISWAYKFAAKNLKQDMMSAVALIELVGISTAVLLLGGAFMLIKNMPKAVMQFAVILGGFIVGISFAFGYAAKHFNEKLKAAMIGLLGLVVASGAVLLAAGYLISSGKIKIKDIWNFIAADFALVGGMALMIKILGGGIPFGKHNVGFNKNELIQGELALAGIVGIIWLLSKANQAMAVAAGMIQGKEKAYKMAINSSFELLGVVFAGVATVAGIIGIGAAVGGAFGAAAVATVIAGAEAIVGGAVIIVGMLGEAMQKIANSLLLFKKLGSFNFNNLYKYLDQYIGILGHLKPFMLSAANPLIGVPLMIGINNAINAITKMSVMISLMANAVHQISSLTIPIYEGTKVIGYRNLDESDFQNAADNVNSIITTLGGAIVTTYNENKEMFSGGLVGDLFGTNTPFEIVVRSCTRMGNMIAKIAGGVKDMAELRVPIYKGTEVVGYRRLGDKDFDLAATNVKKIIETLGGAIIDLYNSDNGNAKAMFHDDTWYSALTGPSASNTPFAIVIKASRGLGSLISEISKGIKDMAELRVPVYTGTKITSYRELKDADFTKAQTNVGKVLTALANGVYQTYLGHEDMFTDTSNWHTRASATPMGMVIGSMNGIGKLLSEISDVLGNVAELQFPIYDENGNKTNRFKKIALKDIQRGGTVYKNIAALISIIPQAICDMYNDNGSDGKSPIKELFEEDFSIGKFFRGTSAKKTKIGIITYAINESTKMLTEVAESIDKLLKLKINTSNLQTTINTLLSSIPTGIQSAAYDSEGNLKEIFKNDDDLSTIENAFDSYKSIITSITSTYTTTNEAFNKLDSKDPKAKMKLITGMINNAISQLTATFHRVLTYNFSSDAMAKLGDVEDAFDTYKDIIKKVFDVYSSANDLINNFKSNISENLINSSKKVKEVGMNKVSGFVDSIDNRIQKMLTNSINNVNIINTKFKDTGALKTFAESLDYYKNGLQLLFATYENAPEDMRKYENVIKAIKKVNIEIASVGKTEEFKAETTEMSLFTHSINSINIQKAHTMQDLISAIEQMAVRLGGLDSLTDALANKLAVVLDKLVRELKESAKTINKADEMQKKRHDAIKKSITTINQLMAKPINVEVKQLPMDDPNQNSIIPPPTGQKPSNGAGGAGSGNDGVSDLNNTNEGNENTGNKNQSSNSGNRRTELSKYNESINKSKKR